MSTPTKQQALQELYRRGILSWKCHPVQKEMYDLFQKAPDNDVLVWLLARQSGKSYLLAILALETALKQPHSIVKLLTDTKLHIKAIFDKIFQEILDDCPESLKPKYHKNFFMYEFPNGSQIQLAGSDGGHYEKLRGQKCLEKHTFILTPTGPKEIQNIKVGDIVYGYNKDGSVSETKVINKFNNGIKEVFDIYKKGEYLFSCTDEHKFLTKTYSSIDRGDNSTQEKELKDIKESNKIVRQFVKIPCGNINEPHAYAIGALIGDGCGTYKGNTLCITSETDKIPNHVKDILNAKFVKKRTSDNYNWLITNQTEERGHSSKVICAYYDEWIKNKYSYEKNFDWDIVNTWNRESCLKLLAGLIDTGGSVYSHMDSNTLELRLTTTSEGLKNNLLKLFNKLFQITPRIKTRKLDKKGKHQAWDVRIRSGAIVKMILKELDEYLIIDYKKYLPKYNEIHSKENLNSCKITKSGTVRLAETYDLEVGNETHLYLLASGLVTHNCDLVLVDEAGFCNDLENVVKSVLMPTTTHTGGKIVLASTPPEDLEHDFLKFIEAAQFAGNLTKKTIDDNPLLDKEQVTRIEIAMGGRTSERFRREYLCDIIKSADISVIPEFTEELENEIVKDWPKPPHYDCYEAMDLGGKDLTVVLFGYYDFRGSKLIIEDELVMDFSKANCGIPQLILGIRERENKNWNNIYTNEVKKPYMRVSDINYIVTQQIAADTHGEIYFSIPKKDDKDAAINNLRVLLANKKIIIHPRCKTLIRHLKNVRWFSQKNKNTFARSPDNGHYDAVDALIYLTRSVAFTKNPYPAGYDINVKDMYGFIPKRDTDKDKQINIFKQIFRVNKR
jgi:hypothetical protein